MGVLYSYLPTKVPDYNSYFPIDSYTDSFIVGGEKSIEIHSNYGTSEERVLFSPQSKFYINLQFSLISEIDEELLFNFYHDENKACGTYRSFYFTPILQYSSEQHTYVVRFNTSLESMMSNIKKYGIGSIQLIVLGKKLD
jgi:hypothetical protein